MTGGERLVRDGLVEQADIDAAAMIAGEVSDMVNRAVNAADIFLATSLVARALIARAIIEVSAEWLADLTLHSSKVSTADARGALLSFFDELPAGLRSHSYIDPDLVALNESIQ